MKHLLLLSLVILTPQTSLAHPQDQEAVCVKDMPELAHQYRRYWHHRHVLFAHSVPNFSITVGKVKALYALLNFGEFPIRTEIVRYYDFVPPTPICDLGQLVRSGNLSLNGAVAAAMAQANAAELTVAVFNAENVILEGWANHLISFTHPRVDRPWD